MSTRRRKLFVGSPESVAQPARSANRFSVISALFLNYAQSKSFQLKAVFANGWKSRRRRLFPAFGEVRCARAAPQTQGLPQKIKRLVNEKLSVKAAKKINCHTNLCAVTKPHISSRLSAARPFFHFAFL